MSDITTSFRINKQLKKELDQVLAENKAKRIFPYTMTDLITVAINEYLEKTKQNGAEKNEKF